MNDLFFVAPSSAAPDGLGLFAKRPIPKGIIFPGYYKGVRLPYSEYAALNEDLMEFQKMYPKACSENTDCLAYLKERYGLRVFQASRKYRAETDPQKKGPSDFSPMYDWVRPVFESNVPAVNWQEVQKAIGDYAFEHAVSENVTDISSVDVTLLPRYSTGGKVIFNLENPINPYVFMNEPPSCNRFYNAVKRKYQLSAVNVNPEIIEADGKVQVGFESLRDIQPGDELFICYGLLYNRPGYTINMSKESGCGAYNIVHETYLKKGVTRHQYESADDISPLLNARFTRQPGAAKYFGNVPHYRGKKSCKLV